MKSFEFVDAEKYPSANRLANLFDKSGLEYYIVRVEDGIHLTLEGKWYNIPFGDWITTNLEKGHALYFRHWTPTADTLYALAA